MSDSMNIERYIFMTSENTQFPWYESQFRKCTSSQYETKSIYELINPAVGEAQTTHFINQYNEYKRATYIFTETL